MQLNDLRIFHAIAEAGGFVKASQTTNQPKSSLSRRITALEKSLGVKLFHRDGRGTQLTREGQRYYERSKELLAQFDSLNDEVRHQNTQLNGSLRIQVPPESGEMTHIIAEFAAAHPELSIDLVTSSEYLDLNKHNLDASFIIDTPPDCRYTYRQLAELPRLLLASSEYLTKHGTPKTAESLADHEFILSRSQTGMVSRNLMVNGTSVSIDGRWIVDTGQQMVRLAVSGHGLICAPFVICADEIVSNELVLVLEEEDFGLMSFGILYHSPVYASMASALFRDYVSMAIPNLVKVKQSVLCSK